MANPHPVSRLNKPNKYSSARVQRALAEGKRLPPEDLLTLAGNCMAMAARFAPVRVNDKTKKPERNRDYNYDRYLECMRDARECLKAAATRSSAPSCGAAFDRQRRHPYRGADASGGAAQMHNAALAAVRSITTVASASAITTSAIAARGLRDIDIVGCPLLRATSAVVAADFGAVRVSCSRRAR
jgi:hypothetical protein